MSASVTDQSRLGDPVLAFHTAWSGPRTAQVVGVNKDGTVNVVVALDPGRDAPYTFSGRTHTVLLHVHVYHDAWDVEHDEAPIDASRITYCKRPPKETP